MSTAVPPRRSPPFLDLSFGGASSSVTSSTTSRGLGRDVRSCISSLRLCFRHGVPAHLCDIEGKGACAVYRLSLTGHRPFGYAPFPRCCRSRFGFPCTRDVLVRLDRFCCVRRSRGQLRTCTVPRPLV